MEGRFRFLGTGSSLGVPVIGCKCATCLSHEPKNKRSRSAALISWKDKSFLLDASPDYRAQALNHKIHSLDGFILTHAHYDHFGGFDDLRAYGSPDQKLPCLMLENTFLELKDRYSYLLKPREEDPLNSSFFSWQFLQGAGGEAVFQGMPLRYVTFFQMRMQVMGLKIGNLAYLSDIKEYSSSLFKELEGVDTLIISALRREGSHMHFSLEEAIAFAGRLGVKKTYLTHIAHELSYEELIEELPPFILPAYDGLEISFVSE